MRVVYLDVLFALNTAVDYLLLSLVAYLRGSRTSLLRLLAASLLGGVLAAALFFAPDAMTLPLGLASSAALCRCAFHYPGLRRFCGDCAALFAASFLLAGAVEAAGGVGMAGAVYGAISLRVLLIGSLAAFGVLTLIFRRNSLSPSSAPISVRCSIRGCDVSFNAYHDTGNRLTEPLSGKGVIVTAPEVLRDALTPEERAALARLTRDNVPEVFAALAGVSPSLYGIAPFSAAGGHGLMLTLRPQHMTVDGRETDDYILGIGPGELEPARGCRALIGGIV